MLDRHKKAIRFNDELVYIKENEKLLNAEEKTYFYNQLGALLEAEVELHTVYVLVNMRAGK